MIRSVLLAVTLGCALYAQNQPTADNPMSNDVRTRYNYIKTNIIRAAEKMPEENYIFKPTAEIRDFGQLISHTTDVQMRFCSNAAGAPKNLNAASMKSKADLVAALKTSFETCDPLFANLTDAKASELIVGQGGAMMPRLNVLYYDVTHDNEMYGVMGVYMRLKGVVPPSSENNGKGKGQP